MAPSISATGWVVSSSRRTSRHMVAVWLSRTWISAPPQPVPHKLEDDDGTATGVVTAPPSPSGVPGSVNSHPGRPLLLLAALPGLAGRGRLKILQLSEHKQQVEGVLVQWPYSYRAGVETMSTCGDRSSRSATECPGSARMSSGFMPHSFGCRIWLMLNAVSVPGMRFSLPPNGPDAEK